MDNPETGSFTFLNGVKNIINGKIQFQKLSEQMPNQVVSYIFSLISQIYAD